jgi:SAM-dependent methyltransferase
VGTAGQAYWDRVFATGAEAGLSWFEADLSARVALIAEHVPDRATALLDVGAGLSRLIPALRAAGYADVTALDISAEAVAQAVGRSGTAGVQWIVADVTEWRPPRRYGLWHDRAALHFLIAEADRAAYRRALDAATGPGATVILAAFAPEGPARCSGLPVCRQGRAEFEALLGPGFTTRASFAADHLTPGGAMQRFQTHVAGRLA